MIFQTSKYDYNIGIRRFAELTAKEIEELRQKNIKEFDVNSRIPYSRRDKERFVVGSDGSITIQIVIMVMPLIRRDYQIL